MMVDKKRKSRSGTTETGHKKKKKTSNKKKIESRENRTRRGPHLPNAIRKELDHFKRNDDGESSDGEQIDFDDGIRNDFYEYEEDVPEEESKKNKRFDPVENYQFELPENFEDFNVTSDEDDEEDNHKGDDSENEDEGKHTRMLEEVTGLPSDAFGGRKKKDFIISEAYPESEYNPSGDILDGDGRISIEDLVDPLQGMSGFSKLKKGLHRMEKKSIHAPLPKTDQDRLERKAAYEQSKKDITKWEPVVKRNREASTLYFDEDVDLGFSTIGAIASGFKPRTDFEKKIASFVNQNDVVEAHKNDGARLLELNKISVEEIKDRQDRLAKMRSFLFAHEMKAKRIKKIKSKTYHRLLKKDRKKAAEAAFQMDPEAAKEQAMKQEFKRAEERMTLKHKNSSKWAKRILQRGLQVQDDATREAFSEQLNQHAALTRKMNSVKESSSSDESSDDDDSDDMLAGSDQDNTSKLLTKAKEKTLKVLQGDEELPMSGVLSLPFMVRGLKKRKEAADEEAKRALEEYDSSLTQLEDKNVSGSFDKGASSGRRVFGIPKKIVSETSKKQKSNNYYGNSDSEDDIEAKEEDVAEQNQDYNSLREVEVDPNLLREEFGISQDSVFKSFKDAEDPEPKSTYEVSFLALNSWKKIRRSSDAIKQNESSNSIRESGATTETVEHDQNAEESDGDASDSDSGGEMVDGILSSGPKSAYELPSQEELIRRAFAGDDVEEDFVKDKVAVLNEENPEPEEPVLLPGWGQWTNIQKKKGLPSWMVQEHEIAKNKRLESLKKRKDAHLSNVIISEKLDKKAEKLHTKTLPYPFTSTEVFEQSIRMPIGPEFNPATTVGALNRPEVVKRAGLNIKPIQYEDMSVRERVEARKRDGQKQRNGKDKLRSMKKKSVMA